MTIHYIGSIDDGLGNGIAGVAGQLAQKQMIDGLQRKEQVKVFSYMPRSAFPKSKCLFNFSKYAQFNDVEILQSFYINFPILKWISLNISLFIYMMTKVKPEDVVISYNYSYPSGWPVYLAKQFRGFRDCLIAFDINIPGETVKDDFFNNFNYYSYKKLITKVDRLIAITPNIVDDFRAGDKHSSIVIEGGVVSCSKSNFFTGNKLKLGYAGGLNDFNLVEEMVIAAANLGEICELNILGDGPLRQKVQELAKASKNIKYHGVLEHNECIKVLRECDALLCFRSSKKIKTDYLFPSKFLEYLSLGKIVLSTELPSDSINLEFTNIGESIKDIENAIILLKNKDSNEIKSYLDSSHEFIISRTWEKQSNKIYSFIRE